MRSDSKDIPQHTPLNRPVKVGFIGAGNVLWAYLQCLDRLIPQGLAVEGPIAARNRSAWQTIQSTRPAVQIVRAADEVLESDVDLIVVITSPDSHAILARRALEAGKHVLVEKPIAETVAEARELAELARTSGRHLLAAPFVAFSPTFQMLWRLVAEGQIGKVHSARALYGNSGSPWAEWYHNSNIGPLAEIGIYNLKSLAILLGPICKVSSSEARAFDRRTVAGKQISDPDPDVTHVILQHVSGALSSVVSSNAIQAYRRPAIELYGTKGTANLLGDDWDPKGIDIWTNDTGCWRSFDAVDHTWLWTDGLTALVQTLRSGTPIHSNLSIDIHLIEVLEAARWSSTTGQVASVESTFNASPPEADATSPHYVHDHTRPSSLQ